jgi:uncharacterized protein YyaL (SSP411 family)
VNSQAQAIRRVVDAHAEEGAQGPVSARALEEAERQIARAFDRRNGGFGTQPKFPHPGAMILLLHRWWDHGSDEVRTIVDRTLEGMGRGGVYDQIGGGFHRYSVDAEWIVPHFEKMSYDNSELLRAYLDAYSLFGTEEYAEVARGIVRWVREVASDPEAGYAASQDADVGLHDDGDYFTWTREEAAAVLGQAELEVAAAYYDIGTAGEMHHNPSKNVLYVATSVAELARRTGRTEDAVRSLLASARGTLKAARDRRPAPFVDRTRYTAWNAMMASALLQAEVVLRDEWAGRHALDTLALLRREGEADAVVHTPGGIGGLLDDQVQTAAAALDGYQATGDSAWLGWAEAIMDRVWRDYWDDERGGLFDVAKGREDGTGVAAARAKPVQDNPTPAPNGVAGTVAARLHELTGSPRWRERGSALVTAFAGRASELGLYAATYLLALDWQVNPATHLVIVGPRGDEAAEAMHRQALAAFVPRKVVQRLTTEEADTRPLPPALAGMLSAAASGARAYFCAGSVCRRPAESPDEWRATLQARVLD